MKKRSGEAFSLKMLALMVLGCLLSFLLAGCAGGDEGGSSSGSLPAEPSPQASSAEASSADTSVAAASSAGQDTAGHTPLSLEDFSAYLKGQPVLGPESVTFYRFSFAQNAEGHKLDPLEISTLRGLQLGDSQHRLEELYAGVPLDIRWNGPQKEEWTSVRYESYRDYLQSGEAKNDFFASYYLNIIDGKPEYDEGAVQTAIAENSYGPNHTILRYDLNVHIQSGVVLDISLSISDTTPFAVGYVELQRVVETAACTVTVGSIAANGNDIGLSLGIQNNLDVPVYAVCTGTMVSGKATRDAGVLSQYLEPGGYADALLMIYNDTVRAADVSVVESVTFALQLRSEQGAVLFESGNITLPVIGPEGSG